MNMELNIVMVPYESERYLEVQGEGISELGL